MFDQLESFQSWALAQIVGSLSWPISFMAVSSLGVFIDLSEPSLPIVWPLGLIMGGITALSSSLLVKDQISNTWKWATANMVGITAALTAAYLIFPFVTSPIGFAATGFCSGLIAGAAQSLALERQNSKIIPLMTGGLGWAAAFLFGYLLVVKESTATLMLMPSDFFSALLLGWGVSGPVLLILLIGLFPSSRDKTSSGSGISYN